jgi:hypothetical protein
MNTDTKKSTTFAMSALQAISNGIYVSNYEPITVAQEAAASQRNGCVFFGRLDAVIFNSEKLVSLLVTCDTGQKISLPCVESDIPHGAIGQTIVWKKATDDFTPETGFWVAIAPEKKARIEAAQMAASYLIGIQGVLDAHLITISPKEATTCDASIDISEYFHGLNINIKVSRGIPDGSRLSAEVFVSLQIKGGGTFAIVLRRILGDTRPSYCFGHGDLKEDFPFDFSDLDGLTRLLESIDVQEILNNIPVDKLYLHVHRGRL